MVIIIRIMQAISYLTAVLVAGFVVLLLIGPGTVDYSIGGGEHPFVITGYSDQLSEASSLWPYISVSVLGLAFAYAFFRLARLFGLFAKGRYFSKIGVQHMRVFATIYLALGLISFVANKYKIYQSGKFDDLWNITGNEIMQVMLSLTFLIIAHVLNEARKKNEELDNYF